MPAHKSTRPSKRTAFPQPAQEQLESAVQCMRFAMAAIVVAVGALRHQNADNDEDVALLLQRAAGDRLDIAIEKVEGVLSSFPK